MSEIENLHKEAIKILESVNASEILDLSSDLFLVAEWIEYSKKDCCADTCEKDLCNSIKLETAFLLSLFSEKHCPSLNKILTEFPDFWIRVENYKKSKEEEFNG